MKNKHYLYIFILLGGLLYSLTSCAHKSHHPKSPPVSQDAILSPKLLNSERIKMKYGNYDIKVLNNDSLLRISDLYSVQDDKKTTRTFAVVYYPETVDTIFLTEHTKVLEGQSIGRVFKHHGWKIEKRAIFFGEILPSNEYTEVYTLMGNIAPSKLAIYIYAFYIKKNDTEFQYATIAEVYHPDYLTINTLKHINKDTHKYLEKTTFATPILKQVTSTMKINYTY